MPVLSPTTQSANNHMTTACWKPGSRVIFQITRSFPWCLAPWSEENAQSLASSWKGKGLECASNILGGGDPAHSRFLRDTEDQSELGSFPLLQRTHAQRQRLIQLSNLSTMGQEKSGAMSNIPAVGGGTQRNGFCLAQFRVLVGCIIL